MTTPDWIVIDVQPKEDYTLLLTFADGTKKYTMLALYLIKLFIPNLRTLHFFCVLKLSVVLLFGMMI